MSKLSPRARRRATGYAAASATIALLASACAVQLPEFLQPVGMPEQTVTETETDIETGIIGATETETTPEATETETAEATETPIADDGSTCTWWHNSNTEPMRGFWADVANEFVQAHPGVTINVQAFQNEELRRTILPNAFTSGNAPDLFQSWGGGELVDWVHNGYVKDISTPLSSQITSLGPVVHGWQINGRTYGLPYTFGPSGFWYNKDVLTRAGIDLAEWTPPVTLDELYKLWDTLKEAGEVPVALGGADTWPSAHWWYWTALRSVPPELIEEATLTHHFDDPTWVTAGKTLADILKHEPFNEGWETTSAQQFADSATGQVVSGHAAMELMGAWAPNAMIGIWNEQSGAQSTEPPNWIGWFPFPTITGGEGDQTAILGGGDGFSVAADAPPECVELLGYILSPDVQRRYAALGNLPVLPAAKSAVTFAPLRQASAALEGADHVQLWLDVAFGQEIGIPMNNRISSFMQGHGTSQDVVDAIREAAGTMPVEEPEPTE